MYVIFTLFIERSYISNKKARLEYYEFRIVKIEDTYIAVEELGKHEIFCRQISPAADKQYVFFLRQRQADVIVITESHFDKFSPVSYHRRKFDLGFWGIYFHASRFVGY